MIHAVYRSLLLAVLTLGILLPQASAVMAGLGLADGRVVVICTGDGLRTLRIDDRGVPVEVSQEAELCALVHALDISGADAPPDGALRLIHSADFALPETRHSADIAHSPSQPRAPPTA